MFQDFCLLPYLVVTPHPHALPQHFVGVCDTFNSVVSLATVGNDVEYMPLVQRDRSLLKCRTCDESVRLVSVM